MGITQQIGASSIIKPGVCTSSTRPASPYEGQMIYETDTDKVLLWDGSTWTPSTGVLPNIVESTTTNSLTTTSTSFTATPLTVTITKSHATSAILVIASPMISVWSGVGSLADMSASARLIETGSSRQRDFLRIIRSYNVNGDPRVETTKACLQWIDTATGVGSRTYRLDVAITSGATVEFNQYANGLSMSEITAWEIIQ
jgi:hypothetical protein